MDDYFIAAKTTPANQSMLGMFRFTEDAKLWWKQHYRDIGVAEDSQSWREIKQAVKEMYLSLDHEALKMNEFFALKQRGLSLEEYYSKLVSVRRYAPTMTIEQQVARFCQGLNEPISSRLEAMKPTIVQDALLRAKALIKERGIIGQRRRFESNQSSNDPKQQPRNFFANPQHHRAYAANIQNPPQSDIRCFECNNLGHYRNRCPHLAHRAAAAAESGPRRPGGRNTGHERGRGRAARILGETKEGMLTLMQLLEILLLEKDTSELLSMQQLTILELNVNLL
ncbi:hypothetical protein L7F22_000005 [Adiantum nelumboides]|nr:hypothetical protein [Adiantum nelumboides]